MASIIPFLDESETLFSQEDVIKARTTIMENLNDLITAGSAQTKIELIVKIQEQVLKWAPAMRVLEEVIDDILALAHDQSQDVKKAIIGFIEEVCKLRIRLLPKVIKSLMLLLREDAAAVTKRVIQACGSIYKNTLQWMCSSEDVTEEMKDCWDQLCFVKAQILDMIDHENDGIRTNAIKFLEGVVLLQTHPDPDSIKVENDFSLDDVPLTLTHIRRRKLSEEAMSIFEILLKFHGASHISSVNLIACTGTLCIIAKRRPSLMAQVVDALKNLHSNLPPTLTNSQVSSVRKNLKMQFINLLKLPSSFEWRSLITPILSDLGASQNEINRAMPKMDKKELQMRTKRALENEEARNHAKKARLEIEEKKKAIPKLDMEMEVDHDEIKEQQNKSNVLNEKFIADAIKNVEIAAHLVVTNMPRLPDRCPQDFIKIYQSGSVTLTQQIDRIAKGFAQQLTESKLGPGSKEITEKPPLRAKMSAEEERNIIMSGFEAKDDEENLPNDETARKVRETLERIKPKLKQRIKTLKLHEITKPLHKDLKHQFLLDAVQRVLKCERYANIGGMGFKRKKIITIFASTFMPSVRAIIMDYIMDDIIKRFDLAFLWLFEEYSLVQGFTRHTYVKSEHKHDHAYNLLLSELSTKILSRGSEFRERESLIKRLYLEAPIISDDSVKILESMAENEELFDCGLVLLKDLIIRRPPKEEQLLETLLKFTAHKNQDVREKAIEYVMSIYSLHKILLDQIELFSITLLKLLEKPSPTREVIKMLSNTTEELPDAWSEDMIKACLNLYLTLIPFKESLINSLCDVYNAACPEVKRVILRSIEVTVKKLGPDSKDLLNIVESCAKGTETLVTRIIYIIAESHSPTADLVEKVRSLYNSKFNDVRILIPIVLYLTKKEIISALPKFLKLNPQLMKDVFTRLLIGNPQPITPTELLVALHAIDTSQAELKLIVKATSMCLSEKEIYTHEVLGVVMQHLVEMSPLPTLLMRTVIQSHTLFPRLSGFIINLLHRLIAKQVWRNKLIWDGFVKCCQRLQPASMGVLIQLPTSQLQDALNICPDLRAPLLEHAQEMNRHQSSHMTQQVLDLLLGKSSSSSELKNEPMDQSEPDAPGM